MPRLYEWSTSGVEGDAVTLIDLDKIVLVRALREPHHHFPKLSVRLVDGEEIFDIAPPEKVQAFLDAFRQYVSGQS